MDVVFGEAFANVDADAIKGNMDALFPAAGALVEAVKTEADGNDSNEKYYEASKGLSSFLIEKCGIDLGLSDANMYALVKLLGPVIVDRNYEPETAPTDMIGLLAYFVPLIQLYTLSPHITFAHQFDVVIGRLKALAGMPEMEGFDIRITEPAAGDPAAKATSEVVEFVDSLGNSWLTAEAAWEGAGRRVRRRRDAAGRRAGRRGCSAAGRARDVSGRHADGRRARRRGRFRSHDRRAEAGGGSGDHL